MSAWGTKFMERLLLRSLPWWRSNANLGRHQLLPSEWTARLSACSGVISWWNLPHIPRCRILLKPGFQRSRMPRSACGRRLVRSSVIDKVLSMESELTYNVHTMYSAGTNYPGRNPPMIVSSLTWLRSDGCCFTSRAPRITRSPSKASQLLMKPMPIKISPQVIVMNEMKYRGPIFRISTVAGNSNMIYGMKKMSTTRLCPYSQHVVSRQWRKLTYRAPTAKLRSLRMLHDVRPLIFQKGWFQRAFVKGISRPLPSYDCDPEIPAVHQADTVA